MPLLPQRRSTPFIKACLNSLASTIHLWTMELPISHDPIPSKVHPPLLPARPRCSRWHRPHFTLCHSTKNHYHGWGGDSPRARTVKEIVRQEMKFSYIFPRLWFWYALLHVVMLSYYVPLPFTVCSVHRPLSSAQRGSSKGRVLINIIQEWLKSYAGWTRGIIGCAIFC